MRKLIFALSMVAAVSAGCSSVSRGGLRYAGNVGAEIRGAAPVHPRRAKALVSGPAVVKHLETEGDGAVTLYLADDPGIADRSCPSALADGATPVAVLQRASRVTDLDVPAGKRICAAATETHTMTVSWHARAGGETQISGFDVALARR
jgi:hypothetical protein